MTPRRARQRNWARGAMLLALVSARRSRAEDAVEIEVRGDRIALPPKEPSVAGGVIRGERLHAPGLEAGDALRTEPGVGVMQTGGYGSLATASLRGATSAQTPVYLAGVRLNDDVGGAADLSTVPLWFLSRVEIYRSNAPLAGDQLGLGGALFFEPRRPRANEVAVGALTGSYGARSVWARAGAVGQRSSALLGVRFDRAKNDYSYLNDGGTRFQRDNDHVSVFSNADTQRLDVWAVARTELGARGHADLVLNDVEREQGLQTLALFPTSASRARFSRRLAALSANVPCAARGCLLTASTSAVTTHSVYSDPLREVGLGTDRLDFDAWRIDDALSVRWDPFGSLSLSPSMRMGLERSSIAADGSPTAHARRISSRAALQAELSALAPLTLRALGSVQCDGTELAGPLPWSAPGDAAASHDNAACRHFEPAARFGAELVAEPLTWLVTAGRYARVPTLSELYGLSGVVRGNAALVPESGVSIEAGVRPGRALRAALAGISFDLFGFVRWSRDLISYQRSSIGYVRPFNVGAARVAGVELQSAYRPTSFLRFELAATALDARDTSAERLQNDHLPYQPQLTLCPRAELHVRSPAPGIASATSSISYFYEASRFADRAGLIVVPAQGSLDWTVGLYLRALQLSLDARVTNVLDQTRFDLIGYPLSGRAAYFAMETEWP